MYATPYPIIYMPVYAQTNSALYDELSHKVWELYTEYMYFRHCRFLNSSEPYISRLSLNFREKGPQI